MPMTKIKINDVVMVRKGKDKGTTGKVVKLSADGQRVLVEGVNVKVKHQKPNQRANVEAGIYKEPRMLSIANVGLVHPSNKKKTGRVGFKTDDKGNKIRIFKANSKEIK